MFVLKCPYCGERDQSEFAYAGEAHIARPMETDEMSDGDWAKFVFIRSNPKGIFSERWWHAAGCRKFFNVVRNTATDEILAVYEIGQQPPEVESVVPATPCGEAIIGSGNDAVKVMKPDEIAAIDGDPSTPAEKSA